MKEARMMDEYLRSVFEQNGKWHWEIYRDGSRVGQTMSASEKGSCCTPAREAGEICPGYVTEEDARKAMEAWEKENLKK